MGETNDAAPVPTSFLKPSLQQDVAFGVEKFSATDLISLRNDLLHSGADSFQAAEIVAAFLMGRGYGISNAEARIAASAIEHPGVTPEHIQVELERVARVA